MIQMKLLQRLCDTYAQLWIQNGGYEIHVNHCQTGYIQSFAVRSLCAGYQLTGQEDYLQAAGIWAEFVLRLQGSQGHPAAYNMGYHNSVRCDGVPRAWYPADCGDIALAVLHVASLLKVNDPLRRRLLQSVSDFAAYVLDYWSNADHSVGGYVEDYQEHHYNFWCADARICNVLWGLEDLLATGKYLQPAIALTHHSATIDLHRFDSKDQPLGYGYSQAVYMPDAICNGLHHLGSDHADVRQEGYEHLERFVAWAKDNQQKNGGWIKNASGLEEEAVGGYHGLMLTNLVLAESFIGPETITAQTTNAALQAAESAVASPELVNGPNLWGMNAMLGIAFAVQVDTRSIFPRPTDARERARGRQTRNCGTAQR